MNEIGTLRLRAGNDAGIVALRLSVEPGVFHWASEVRLEAEGLRTWTAAETGMHADESLSSLLLIAVFEKSRDEYVLHIGRGPAGVKDHTETRLEHGHLTLDLLGFSPTLRVENRVLAEIRSDLTLGGRRIAFDRGYRKILHLGGNGEGLRQSGVIKVPEETAPGSYQTDFFRLPGLRCLFVSCRVQYPEGGGKLRWERGSPLRWELKEDKAQTRAEASCLRSLGDGGCLRIVGLSQLPGGIRREDNLLLLDPLGREGEGLNGAREQGLIAAFADLTNDALDAAQAEALMQRPELLEASGPLRLYEGDDFCAGKAELPPAEKGKGLADRLRSLFRKG